MFVTAEDGTDGVELWGTCCSVENSTDLDLAYQCLKGETPPEISNLINLTYLFLSYNDLTGEVRQSVCDLIENNNISIYNIIEGNNLTNTCD